MDMRLCVITTKYVAILKGDRPMTQESKIEWTGKTWNPTTGCTKISPGCKHCYAETMAKRLKAMNAPSYVNEFQLTLHPNRLNDPLKNRKPTIFFVNSMSDLFHELVPIDFIDKVMATIGSAQQHTFQLLTKRAESMQQYFATREAPPNLWVGVSVEDQKYGLPRIEHLREINAVVRFLSVEPLLEDLGDIDLTNIEWVIVGGESGAKARPMHKGWAESVIAQCEAQNVPVFFKQWGTWSEYGEKKTKGLNGYLINGKEYRQMPVGF